jgi:hypothetical protein
VSGSRNAIESQNSKKVNSEDPNREYQAETDDTWSLQEMKLVLNPTTMNATPKNPIQNTCQGTQLGISVPIGLRAISG